jgi:predicted MFS family arabinose efflux permease
MLWLISFFNYADRQAIFSVFPLIEREMRLTPVQLGFLGSVFAWVYGLAAPLAGMVVDRIRRKTAILGGLEAWSVICMATVFSADFRHLVFWRAAAAPQRAASADCLRPADWAPAASHEGSAATPGSTSRQESGCSGTAAP